ncbi:unnamed protein product [Moneuplotes crassus]|uniref:Uncharacterized protein n=1 Tax=Euplotes crassus TaxID=5936 RepID=A0AAD1UMM0_EUPCR|nr:unnamed protein product [Moneuplotes crassus]
MKIVLAFVVVLIGVVYAEGECPIFSCDTIDQEESKNVCSKRIDAADGNPISFQAQRCPENSYCQAKEWLKPEDATGEVGALYCGNTSTSTFPETWVPVNNAALDGDICEKSAHCLKNYFNQATCVDGICQASTKEGSKCDGNDNNCPRRHFCNSDNICAKQVGNLQVCTKNEECFRGYDCIKPYGGEDFICVDLHVLKNGDKFYVPNMESRKPRQLFGGILVNELEGDITLEGSHVCETNAQANVDGVMQCRSLQRNIDQSYTVDNIFTKCKTETFLTGGLDNYNKGTLVETTPLCGFNKDNKAYCPIFVGDDIALDLIWKSIQRAEHLNCHRHSHIGHFVQGRVCKEFYDISHTMEAFYGFRAGQVLTPQTWANTANNDECVRKTITFRHWNGFDSAYNHALFVITMSSLVLITI